MTLNWRPPPLLLSLMMMNVRIVILTEKRFFQCIKSLLEPSYRSVKSIACFHSSPEWQGYNKMGNPSNGRAAVTWLNMLCLDVYHGFICILVTPGLMFKSGQIWSQVVTPGHCPSCKQVSPSLPKTALHNPAPVLLSTGTMQPKTRS